MLLRLLHFFLINFLEKKYIKVYKKLHFTVTLTRLLYSKSKGGISLDFFKIKTRSAKGILEIYPDFKVGRSKDLMVRGKSFYAIWDESKGLWSTDEYDVQRLVDEKLMRHRDILVEKGEDQPIRVKLMSDFSSKTWSEFRQFIGHISDNAHQLDQNLTFNNTEVKKKDYVSKRLPYSLEKGEIDAYDELIGTLYDRDERAKIEWAIGSIVAGDAKNIQKFLVLYGEAGAGKSTVLNIIQTLFQGYYTTFEAKSLTSNNNAFATEVFKANPLVAIQHDGDLSKIEDNTKLNSIISHEEMTMNEKYKPSYMARINCFLFMATNRPVKITDAKSGIIRRLIDAKPSGNLIPTKRYHILMNQIDFELGAIAYHCLETYREMGKNFYSSYRPLNMILQTDVFYNFIEANFDLFKEQDGISLNQAYQMYKEYCTDSLIEYKTPRYKFREELKNYFAIFYDVKRVDGVQVRSYYCGFLKDKFTKIKKEPDEIPNALTLDKDKSILDDIAADYPAQYATKKGTPTQKWSKTTTNLSDLDTNRLHYVKLPENHIVIDFDLKDEKGEKSLSKNIEEASKWPPTYAEFSKSGAGIHLHYIYDGDATRLSRIHSEDIEIKVFTGDSSLRRKLTKCNNLEITTIKSGLPLKGEKMINFDAVKSEKALRDLIKRNLRKEVHPGTKPSIDFIHKILEDAHDSNLKFDVTDMRPAILAFANNSSNQSDYCVHLVANMRFKSEEPSIPATEYKDQTIVFFDVEVFPNLFVIAWKKRGSKTRVKMINPTAKEVEPLLSLMLVGYNCRRYDNHILYARYLGYTNEELFKLSQRIIKGSRNAMFSEAYNISYTDIYDFSAKKQSLKKFQIELGLKHQELGFKWDEPVPEKDWSKVAEYCCNDVDTTEAVFENRYQDFVARLIISDLSGLTPNDTTQRHTERIIFGEDKNPQEKFIYTDLSSIFPGYKFENGKSSYRGEDPKEGGYVYAEPGMYSNVALMDVASMHPYSLINLNAFGPYTKNFEELVEARIAVKQKRYDDAKKMLNGILIPYLKEEEDTSDLAYALKIIINIVYGLTSAKFDNKFKDPRNIDNIVAKRGALFMIDLKHAIQEKGFTVAHVKTDSVKIPEPTKEILDFVVGFGKKYGYDFDHETTYEKLCLVNDAVFIAKDNDEWVATGAQFKEPYVFKTLFSKEPIEFKDLCITKQVTTSLYLDMNEGLKEDEHEYRFVGKVGSFCPIEPGKGGGILLREKEEKFYAATGSKGYRWLEAEVVESRKKQKHIDMGYFNKLVDDAVSKISKFGDFEWFTN